MRLPREKGEYAYRVELCMALLIFHAPVAIAANFIMDSSFLNLGMFFISSQLLIVQCFTFVSGLYKYSSAGCCIIFGHMAVFMLPLFAFFLASAMGVIAEATGTPWKTIGIMWCIAMMLSLHVLYIIRPSWGTMGAALFVLASAFGIMVGAYADSEPIVDSGYPALYAF